MPDDLGNSWLSEWRSDVKESLRQVLSKLDTFDSRLRLIETSVVQRQQIEKMEDRLNKLEGYKQRIIGYAAGIAAVAAVVYELAAHVFGEIFNKR